MPKTYKNIGGPHALADGTIVPPGGTFSSEEDPRALFSNKFELVHTVVAEPPQSPGQTTPGGKAPADPGGGNSTPSGGQDVTAEFNVGDGSKVKLTVVKLEKGYNILEEGDADPVNEKPLAKTRVQAFIDDYLSE